MRPHPALPASGAAPDPAAWVDPVWIADYDPRWPVDFEQEVRRIAATFAEFSPRIEHIGSTAVPGLAAKPVIDILIGLPRLDALRAPGTRLAPYGYEYVAAFEALLPGRRFFRRLRDGVRTHHVHVVQWQSADWTRYLSFRTVLRANARLRAGYGALKRELAARHPLDRDAYTAGKTGFVTAALQAATLAAAA